MKADAVAVSAEALAARAATIDELLSDEFESLPGLKRDYRSGGETSCCLVQLKQQR